MNRKEKKKLYHTIDKMKMEQKKIMDLIHMNKQYVTERRKRIEKLAIEFKEAKKVLQYAEPTQEHLMALWGSHEYLKECIMECNEYVNEFFKRSNKRLKSAQRTTQQLDRIKKKIDSCPSSKQNRDISDNTCSSDVLITNPFAYFLHKK